MELHKVLFEMEDPMNRLRDGICALWVMSLAVDREDSDLSSGFHALWDYLDQMYDRLHTQFYACIGAVSGGAQGERPRPGLRGTGEGHQAAVHRAAASLVPGERVSPPPPSPGRRCTGGSEGRPPGPLPPRSPA